MTSPWAPESPPLLAECTCHLWWACRLDGRVLASWLRPYPWPHRGAHHRQATEQTAQPRLVHPSCHIQWASGSDIDHLAIGPAGVFSINSKRHRGTSVWYGDTAITVNGAVQRHIAVSQSEARRVSRALSRHCAMDVPVRPVISVVHAAKLTAKNANPPVLVLAVERLDQVLSGLSPTLGPEQVAHIYSVARDARTWVA